LEIHPEFFQTKEIQKNKIKIYIYRRISQTIKKTKILLFLGGCAKKREKSTRWRTYNFLSNMLSLALSLSLSLWARLEACKKKKRKAPDRERERERGKREREKDSRRAQLYIYFNFFDSSLLHRF
jgi:hypothetical protein